MSNATTDCKHPNMRGYGIGQGGLVCDGCNRWFGPFEYRALADALEAAQTATAKTCSICERPFYARGYCEMHYRRFLRNDTTDADKDLRAELAAASARTTAAENNFRMVMEGHEKGMEAAINAKVAAETRATRLEILGTELAHRLGAKEGVHRVQEAAASALSIQERLEAAEALLDGSRNAYSVLMSNYTELLEANEANQEQLVAAEAQVAALIAAMGSANLHELRNIARAALAAQPMQGPTRLSGKTATRAFALSQLAAQPTPEPEPLGRLPMWDDASGEPTAYGREMRARRAGNQAQGGTPDA